VHHGKNSKSGQLPPGSLYNFMRIKRRNARTSSVAYAVFLVPVALLLALIWLILGVPEQIMERAGLVTSSGRWTRLALFWSAVAVIGILVHSARL